MIDLILEATPLKITRSLGRRPLDFSLTVITQGVVVTAPDLKILFINQMFTSITGYKEIECIGKTFDFLYGMQTDASTLEEIEHAYQSATLFSGEILNYRKNNTPFWNRLLITPTFDAGGAVTFFTWVIDDISELVGTKNELVTAKEELTLLKVTDDQLRELAFTDPLTKLFTRRLLQDRLAQALLKTARNKKYGALLFVDLDHFKRINDLFGHHAGDLRLIDVAKRLKSCVREEDTVARLGGDEFVLLINELSPDSNVAKQQVINIVEEIVEQLSVRACLTDPMAKPCRLNDGSQCLCSASVGVVPFSGKEKSPEQLLAKADDAMYQAKEAGRNRYQFCEVAVSE